MFPSVACRTPVAAEPIRTLSASVENEIEPREPGERGERDEEQDDGPRVRVAEHARDDGESRDRAEQDQARAAEFTHARSPFVRTCD